MITPPADSIHTPVIKNSSSSVTATESFAIHSSFSQFLTKINHHRIGIHTSRNPITILIRYFGGYSEGVTYAILCMNACAVLLDKIGRPVKFGAPKKEAAKK